MNDRPGILIPQNIPRCQHVIVYCYRVTALPVVYLLRKIALINLFQYQSDHGHFRRLISHPYVHNCKCFVNIPR